LKTKLKKWLVIGGAAAALGTVVAVRRKSSGYDNDVIDAGGQGNSFGDRDGNAPEQRWSPAETRTDITPEQLSMAARIETSYDHIHDVWPVVTLEEVRTADGDLERLAGLIAEKVEQPRDQVRTRLEGILAEETPNPSYPAR